MDSCLPGDLSNRDRTQVPHVQVLYQLSYSKLCGVTKHREPHSPRPSEGRFLASKQDVVVVRMQRASVLILLRLNNTVSSEGQLTRFIRLLKDTFDRSQVLATMRIKLDTHLPCAGFLWM